MFNWYPEELVEEIRTANDIVDVVSEYVKLDKKGKDYFGLCPFHKEKTPSFSVAPNKQIFYCFGCGKGGNIFHFIMNVENLEYIEAVRLLADRARIQLPEGNDEEQIEKAKLKQSLMNINLQAARYFFENLRSRQGEVAKEYLNKRGITESTIKKFGMGYSSEDRSALYKYLLDKGIDKNDLLKSGLVIQSNNGNCHDRFYGRVMFPIFDIRGNVIAFGGRVMDSSTPKYLNSPETPVFNKGRHLYALNFAKNSGEKRFIIVEGYMDVISLHQSGIINTVASLGTALTENQGRLIRKYAEEIVLSYDSDTAGQSAAMRGLDILGYMGSTVKVLTVPDGKDPDEFIRKNGADAFKRLVNNSLSLVEYKIKRLIKDHDTSTIDGKVSFLNKVADVLARIDNNVEREMYLKKMAEGYDISEEALYAEVLRRIRPKDVPERKVTGLSQQSVKLKQNAGDETEIKLIHDERFVLSLLCVDNSMYTFAKERVNDSLFHDEENKKLYASVKERLETNRGISPAELIGMVNGESAGEFARIIKEECFCDDNKKAIMGKIRDIKLNRAESRQKLVLELIKNKSDLPEGDVEKLKEELKTLTLKIMEYKKM